MNFALFETAIGCCGILWSERGIAGVQLPERSKAATRNRLLRRFPMARDGAPPPEVKRAIDDITALVGGERRDLNHLTIDVGAAPEFHRRVYEVARRIPAGATLSYGEVAERLGNRTLARDVAEALSQNLCPIIVALSSDTSSRGQAWRLFRPRRGGNKASAADDRGCTTRRPHAVRPTATGCTEDAALTAH